MIADSSRRVHKNLFNTTLLVVGLGYVIDAFDTFLYNSLRVPSLRDLGLEGDALVKTGLNILSVQVVGMLVGGFVWGLLGDRIGRKKALIGSVLFYSFGSLGCAFVHSVSVYAILRFLTGVGLAGEIGLGAILITETVPDDKRSWGIGIYTLFAYLGIMLATILAAYLPWRTCYAVGGVTGLAVLLGRMILFESGLYEELLKRKKVVRGSLKLLLSRPALLKRWLCCIFFMMPYFYVVNVLITLAPEFGKAVGVVTPVIAHSALMVYSICAMIGTILSVVVSDLLRKRVATIVVFMAANLVLGAYYLIQNQPSEIAFYILCGLMGMTNYFALQLFAAVEQFGTNMRATAGTSAISIGRATLVITNSLFLAFKSCGFDIVPAAAFTGAIVFAIGFACLFGLRETYHQGMDFLEEAA
jgi:MFS family permease